MGIKVSNLIQFIGKRGGLASYAEIIGAGFNKADLKFALESDQLKKIDRGLYRLKEGSLLSYPDIVAASIRAPKGIICLISALAFHEATSEVPHYVQIAIPRGKRANKIMYPPVKFYRYAANIWKEGLEEHEIEGHKVRVYGLARTVVDCFKFRNKIGIDVAREALKVAITEKGIKPKEIMRFAGICRVEKIIKPILEAII